MPAPAPALRSLPAELARPPRPYTVRDMFRTLPLVQFSLPCLFIATAFPLAATGETPRPQLALREIKSSDGDWRSKGASRFSDIVILSLDAAVPVVEATAVALTAEAEAPPRADELLAEYTRAAEALAAERNAAAASLSKEYAAQLDALATRLRDEGKKALAIAALVERARVVAGKDIPDEAVTSAPFEVLSLRAAHLERMRALDRSFDARAAQRAADYVASIEKLAANLASSGDAAGAAAIRALLDAEKSHLPAPPPPAPNAETRRTRAAGGDGGAPYEEMPRTSEALLTGLVLHTGDFAGHRVITAVQPIFRSSTGPRTGKLYGVPHGQSVKVEAVEGYAVGRLNLNTGDRVDGMEIVFMKIKPGGLELDSGDSYKSPWIGGKGGGETTLGSGAPIVGIFGGVGLELDSIGLIERVPAVPAAAVPSRNRPALVKEITKENPATVSVVHLTAEPLVESSSAEAGKWLRVPEPLRGAKIFCGSPIKHNGVADFKVTAAGRVYLACNYDYQGNSSGNWSEDRWMSEQFAENGWSLVQGLELISWENRTFIIFTKQLKEGESGRLRCNKYEPPYFITFQP